MCVYGFDVHVYSLGKYEASWPAAVKMNACSIEFPSLNERMSFTRHHDAHGTSSDLKFSVGAIWSVQ